MTKRCPKCGAKLHVFRVDIKTCPKCRGLFYVRPRKILTNRREGEDGKEKRNN